MKKYLFIGDSITDGGTFITTVEYNLLINGISNIELINLGVSSENTTNLSESSHPFKRPYIFNRLDNIIKIFNADWAFVMYGQNDAIYSAFSEENFSKYKQGITNLVQKLKKAGYKVAVLTPTPFDKLSFKGTLSYDEKNNSSGTYHDYDSVMKIYTEWIINNCDCDKIIDVRTPILEHNKNMRENNKNYTSGDGIHQGIEGNYLIAKTILSNMFDINIKNNMYDKPCKLYKMIAKRQKLSHIYYKELIGHENPHKEKYISKEKFEKKYTEYTKKIMSLLDKIDKV